MGDTNILTSNYHHLPANIFTMQHRGYVVFLGLLSALLGDCSEKLDSASEKAASPLINCGCQCSSLTFRDANGVVQGNCLTVDSTGAQWCYVDSAYSSCQDLVPSKRFPNNPWSYEACATPAQGSPLCPVAPVYPPSDSYHHDHHDHHDHYGQQPLAVIYSPEQIGEPRETQEGLAVATKDQVNFNTEENLPSK